MVGILMFATSLSMDALGIGLSYGVRKIKIPVLAKCIISLLSAAFMGAFLFVGTKMAEYLPEGASTAMGIGILIFMGVWIIIQGMRQDKEKIKPVQQEEKTILNILIKSLGISIRIMREPELGDMNQSNIIEPSEAFYIGIALSADSVGAGIAGAALGLNHLTLVLAVACGQFLFLSLGSVAGGKLSNYSTNSKVWVFLSGGLLIVLGIIRMV